MIPSSQLVRREILLCCDHLICLSQPELQLASYSRIPTRRHLPLSLWGVARLLSSQVGGGVPLARGLWIIINGCLAMQLCKAFGSLPSITEPPATLSLRLLPSPCGYYLTFPFRSNSSNLSSWLPGSVPINPCQQLRSR